LDNTRENTNTQNARAHAVTASLRFGVVAVVAVVVLLLLLLLVIVCKNEDDRANDSF
jgi:uncharacterized integral membrane protein